MTPAQASGGFVELDLPDGGCVLVQFGDEAAGDSDVEAAVVLMMLQAAGGEADVRAALADYAVSSGLATAVTTDRGAVTVTIG